MFLHPTGAGDASGISSVSPGRNLAIIHDYYRAKDAAGRRASWIASPRISSAGSSERGRRVSDGVDEDSSLLRVGNLDPSLSRPRSAPPSEGSTPTNLESVTNNPPTSDMKKKEDKKSKKEKAEKGKESSHGKSFNKLVTIEEHEK